jgi:hypothetical protein
MRTLYNSEEEEWEEEEWEEDFEEEEEEWEEEEWEEEEGGRGGDLRLLAPSR